MHQQQRCVMIMLCSKLLCLALILSSFVSSSRTFRSTVPWSWTREMSSLTARLTYLTPVRVARPWPCSQRWRTHPRPTVTSQAVEVASTIGETQLSSSNQSSLCGHWLVARGIVINDLLAAVMVFFFLSIYP